MRSLAGEIGVECLGFEVTEQALDLLTNHVGFMQLVCDGESEVIELQPFIQHGFMTSSYRALLPGGMGRELCRRLLELLLLGGISRQSFRTKSWQDFVPH